MLKRKKEKFNLRKQKGWLAGSSATQTICVSFLLVIAAGTLLLLLVPGPLLGLFNADAAVLADGVPALRLVSLSFVFAAVGIIFSSSFQALGCPMLSLILSLLRQVVLLLPAALVLGLLAPRLIWLSFLLAEGFSSLLALVLYRRLYRTKLARLEE